MAEDYYCLRSILSPDILVGVKEWKLLAFSIVTQVISRDVEKPWKIIYQENGRGSHNKSSSDEVRAYQTEGSELSGKGEWEIGETWAQGKRSNVVITAA